MASLTDPTGSATGDVGNGIAVYGFDAGKITPERMIPIGLQKLAGDAEDEADWRGGWGDGSAVSGGDCGGMEPGPS